MLRVCVLLLVRSTLVDACSWTDQKFQITASSTQSQSFWCNNMDGSVDQPVKASFKSPSGDSYAFKVGIYSDATAKCDWGSVSPDISWPDEKYSDAFDHTSSKAYPANFKSETVCASFWCHNWVTTCNIEVTNLAIGAAADGELGQSSTTIAAPSAWGRLRAKLGI